MGPPLGVARTMSDGFGRSVCTGPAETGFPWSRTSRWQIGGFGDPEKGWCWMGRTMPDLPAPAARP